MIIRDLGLNEVELTEPILRNAFVREQDYLRSIDADRLLAGFRETAGLEKKAERYPGGWENSELSGHTLGHYMVALSQAYASTKATDLKERLEYILGELSACQAENGYLFATGEEIFDKLEEGGLVWMPWYTMHKLINGLLAVYRLVKLPLALSIVKKLGDWICERVLKWTDKEQRKVLCIADGGMNDCLYELYKEIGKEEYLAAAVKFEETSVLKEIADGTDTLANKHANNTIPKFLAAVNRYLTEGEKEPFYLDAAKKFFDLVLENHTYIIGGNGEVEHFREPKTLGALRSQCNCESCSSYNMLKLAERLYAATGEKRYMDYYERTLLNAVLGSQNPETGMTAFFQPMESGHFKTFGKPFSNFWCCIGTGMESFTKLNRNIYHRTEDAFYVNLYIASKLISEETGVCLTQSASLERFDTVEVTVGTDAPNAFRICFRMPEWAGNGTEVKVNGEETKYEVKDGYITLDRMWKDGDRVELLFAPELILHLLPDVPNSAAAVYGPFVLAAGLGKEDMTVAVMRSNVTVSTKNVKVHDRIVLEEGLTLEEWFANCKENFVKREDELAFTLQGTDADDILVFTPYYKHYKERYGVYFDYFDRDNLPEDIRAELEEQKRIEEERLAAEAAEAERVRLEQEAEEARLAEAAEEERARTEKEAEAERLAAETAEAEKAEAERVRLVEEAAETARLAEEAEAAEAERLRLEKEAEEERMRREAEEEEKRRKEDERLAAEAEANRLAAQKVAEAKQAAELAEAKVREEEAALKAAQLAQERAEAEAATLKAQEESERLRREKEAEEERLRREKEAEEERLRMEKEAEAERLRLENEAEAEAKRLAAQKAADAEYAAEIAEAKAREEEAALKAAQAAQEKAEAEAAAAKAEAETESAKAERSEAVAKKAKADKEAEKAKRKAAKKRQRAYRDFSGWKVFAGIVAALVVIVVLYLFATPISKGFFIGKDAVDTFLADKLPAVAEFLKVRGDGDAMPVFKDASDNVYYVEDAEAYVKETAWPEGYQASVTRLSGKQYICIEGNGLKTYYLNEGPENGEKHVYLEKDGRKALYFWEYGFDVPEKLCPQSGAFNTAGDAQYAFFTGTGKHGMYVLDAETLEECKIILHQETLYEALDAEAYTEEDDSVRIDLKVGEIPYSFAVPKKAGAVVPEGYEIAVDGMMCTVDEAGGRVEAYVVSADAYLGKLFGSMEYSNQVYEVKNLEFYAYAGEEFGNGGENPVIFATDAEGVKVPRIEVLGDKGERLWVPVREDVKKYEYSASAFLQEKSGELRYIENGKTTSSKGIKVSSEQGWIDWDTVAASGVEYAMIGIGFRGDEKNGTCRIDSQYKRNVSNALKEGIEAGVYFVSRATTVEEAKEEAQFVIKNLKSYDITWPVALDTTEAADGKETRASGLTSAERTACAKAFMEEIAAAGYTPVWYANDDWSVLKLNMGELADYDMWYVSEDTEDAYPYHYTMWQYKSDMEIPGINKAVGLNLSFVDYGAEKEQEQ